MTENEMDALLEGAQEPAAAPLPVVPSGGSLEAGSEPSGPDVSAVVQALQAEVAELRKQVSKDALDAAVDARFKSGKDKRLAKVDEIYEWVQASGGDPKKIEKDLQIRDLASRLEAVEGGSRGAVGAAPELDNDWSKAQAETDIILRNAGIASDDPNYSQLVDQYRGKIAPRDWPDVVERYAKVRRGNPAVAAGEGGSTPPPSADIASISQRLDEATRTGAPLSEIKKLNEQLVEALKSA